MSPTLHTCTHMCTHVLSRGIYHIIDCQILSYSITENSIHLDRTENKNMVSIHLL